MKVLNNTISNSNSTVANAMSVSREAQLSAIIADMPFYLHLRGKGPIPMIGNRVCIYRAEKVEEKFSYLEKYKPDLLQEAISRYKYMKAISNTLEKESSKDNNQEAINASLFDIQNKEGYKNSKNKPKSKKKSKKSKSKKNDYRSSMADPKRFRRKSKEREQLNSLMNEELEERPERLPQIMACLVDNSFIIKVTPAADVYMYNNTYGCYEKLNNNELETRISTILTKSKRLKVRHNEIIEARKQIMTMPEFKDDLEADNKTRVNCMNGVFNVETGELEDHNIAYNFTRYINANYDPSATGETFKYFVKDVCNGDNELITLLQEVMGYALSFSSAIKAAVIFYGPHDTGKSTVLKLISEICGSEHVSCVNIQDYEKTVFAAKMRDKAINIAPDLPSAPLKDIGAFKSAVSGIDVIETKELYKNPVSTPCTAKHLFGANQLIPLKGMSADNVEAFMSRIVIVPFLNQKDKEDMDHDLNTKLQDEFDYIFTWAMDGLMRLYNNNWYFSYSKQADKIKRKYRARYAPEKVFFEDQLELAEGGIVSTREVQDAYNKFAKKNGLQEGDRNMVGFIQKNYDTVTKKKMRYGENKSPINVYEGLRFKA